MPASPPAVLEAVRRFNRFYTRQIGLLEENFLHSPYTLTEVRVLWEISQAETTTARDLAGTLHLDPGYLSRLLRGLRDRNLVQARPLPADRRQHTLSLSARGRTTMAGLDAQQRDAVSRLLHPLTAADRRHLVEAMHSIASLLGAREEPRVPYLLRPPRSGDFGWVVQRHGALYREEYGWDERFEALVARIVAEFVEKFDPRREGCWIAEREGENVGSVFLVRHPRRRGVAQLRLLLVEPGARGLGVGRRLVQECSRFARGAGYQRITLWTNSVLEAARAIYLTEGYQLIREEAHRSFGHRLVGQTWELDLHKPSPE